MKTGLSQNVRLGQELRINPRLYQAMDMLYMPLLDLQQYLKQELLVNPFLELSDETEDGTATEAADEADATGDDQADAGATDDGDEPEAGERDDDADADADDLPDIVDAVASTDDSTPADAGESSAWDEVLQDGFADEPEVREEHEAREYVEPVSVATRDLADDLREQLRMQELTPRQMVLADEFIGNIADDGYLTATLDEIRDGVNETISAAAEKTGHDGDLPLYTDAEVSAMLDIVQDLDPPGIGARDLQECLLLQLRRSAGPDALSVRLVRDHFDDLVGHRWGDVARKLGVTPAEAQAAADEVAKLNPKPGRAGASGPDSYVVPDLIVERVDDEYLVFINDGNLPRLRLSRSYQDLARQRQTMDAEHREFIASKLNSAQWLVQAIEQRRQTMLKVMHFIVNRQREFFDKGIQYLKPLTLRDVAEAIGMHESTVSRVTNEKYAQTPRGVLPLKFFFSGGLATAGGEDVSARGIKATIQKLVQDENPRDPLTDQAIAGILASQGVQIARRTVAKYREQLGVLPARMRKRV